MDEHSVIAYVVIGLAAVFAAGDLLSWAGRRLERLARRR